MGNSRREIVPYFISILPFFYCSFLAVIFAYMITVFSDHCASTVLMVKPNHFGFNVETAKSNIFQNRFNANQQEIANQALAEVDNFTNLLKKYAMEVIVFEIKDGLITPDAVFPNNWFTTHSGGRVILYPMLANNRRLERRMDILEILKTKYRFKIKEIIDLSVFEDQGVFCEGTGSLVFDHNTKTAFACLSSRTHKKVVVHVCDILNYNPVIFDASLGSGEEIYHTNVLLTITQDFGVICDEAIRNNKEREMVCEQLSSSGKELVRITVDQLKKFAGNMLQLLNKNGELVTVMSQTAFESLTENQLEVILSKSRILPIPIPVIENIGGGSVRCMMAEIFLEKE